MPLEPGVVKDGAILDEAAAVSSIKELFQTEQVKARKVITGLSGRHCLSRLITLPRLSKSLLAEAIRREAERLLPVPLEDLYLSWQTITSGKDEVQVFLIAFPRNAADALTKTLRQAGIDPYLIDIKPLALARVVDKATAIVVDVQPTDLDIVVIVDRIPQLIRTVSLPGDAQSQHKKMAVVIEELDRTIKFYNSSHEQNPLDPDMPVFVSGELVKESEDGATLAGKLKAFAIPLSSPLKYHRAIPPSRYMVNVGLVLKETPLPKKKAAGSIVNVNTSPQVYQPKPPRSLGELLLIPGIVVALAALVFPITFVQNAAAETDSLRNQLNITNERYNQVKLQKKAISELQSEIAKVETACENYNKTLEHFDEQHEIINNDLTEVTSSLSSSLELGNVAHIIEELTVSGMATDETVILGYAERLRDSERFAQVIVSSVEKTEDGMSFKLTLIK